MRFRSLFVFLILLSGSTYSQNAYQSQLYLLTDKLNLFEKQNMFLQKADRNFLLQKLNLVKDFHRLNEEVQKDAYSGNVNNELAANIALAADFAVNRLQFLGCYFKFRDDLYKTNYDRAKTIFLSLYLKVKAME